jgi:soluble lytic murein transglycosylase-like protein
MKKNNLSERVALQWAKARRKAHSKALLRFLGGRGAATVILGAALSIGGLADAVKGMHLVIEKDLDSVQVVRQRGSEAKVVANLQGFAGNTVFKLAQVLPDRYVTRQLSLFSDAWLPEIDEPPAAPQKKGKPAPKNVFLAEMERINDAIRREFFEETIPYGEIIHQKAEKYDVDPALVAAVIEQESRFRQRAKSPVGARGLMQLMPRTGRWMGARDLYDPEQNIDAGVKYIKYLETRFNGNLKKTIAAYNAGEGNVMRYKGIPPFRETQHYVKKVLRNYDKRQKQLENYEQQRGSSAPEADVAMTIR